MDHDEKEKLKSDYLTLLGKEAFEQEYQSFLEDNTFFVPREFVLNHGIHFSLLFRKTAFGSDMCSDFMYLTKSSVRWHCVLIEIEKPQSKYFKKNTSVFHNDFVHALQQINDWRAWLEISANKDSFLSNTIGFVRTPLGENAVDMKYILVHGRRCELEGNSQRRARVRSLERPDFRIMSFDSLCEDLDSKHDLYVASKRNNHVEIISSRFVNEGVFTWLGPEMVKIGCKLKSEMELMRGKTISYRVIHDGQSRKRILALDHYLDSI